MSVASFVWIAVAVLCAILEATTAQLISIWFVLGAAAGFVGAVFNLSVVWQIIIFIAVSVISLLATRPLVRKYINPKKQATNADRVINQTGVVTQKIDNINATGQIKVDGKIWTARSQSNEIIEKDSLVKIIKIDGVKLIVEKN